MQSEEGSIENKPNWQHRQGSMNAGIAKFQSPSRFLDFSESRMKHQIEIQTKMRQARVCLENSSWFVELHKIVRFIKVQTNADSCDTEKY